MFSIGARRIFCALGAAVFLWFSAPIVWRSLGPHPFGSIAPYHTTDPYFLALLNLPSGSQRLIRSCADLPLDRPVSVNYREGNDESLFVAYLVSYFAWPRETRLIPVNRENALARPRELDRATQAAIFFCDLPPPPASAPVISIGNKLVMIRP